MPPNSGHGRRHGSTEPPRSASAGARRLRICADDYGMSPAVNHAIRDLLTRRRINATSVMVVAPSHADAEAEALVAIEPARHAIGLHFTLTAPFRPATGGYRPTAHGGTFPTLREVFTTGLARRLDPGALEDEAFAQLEAFRKAIGRLPDFVDGHQHVHLLPQVTDALIAVTRAVAPSAWMRQCGRADPWRGWNDPKGHVLDWLSRRVRARCSACGIQTNPTFAGTYDLKPGRDYEALFARFLEGHPDGGLVMCHPGLVDAQLRMLDPVTVTREQEYRFFVGERFTELVASRGFVLA
jgi:chitin disaccharide deacetylase